ncbi:hypothetical protein RB653_003250 [Dictyostelium firmibasis]|uniref:MRH domain-containing protein n=1 Tax=Dictyostelium firmibasis TaxID=79012 RepID=A0AAN7TRY7_9MYCE
MDYRKSKSNLGSNKNDNIKICVFESIGLNKIYNFTSQFSQSEYITSTDDSNIVHLNLCNQTKISVCQETNACLSEILTGNMIDLGSQISSSVLPTAVIINYKSNKTYPQCQFYTPDLKTTTVFTVNCNETNQFKLESIIKFSECSYGITYSSKLACVCPGNCSSHGVCNMSNSTCLCEKFATGSACNELNVIISTVSSTTIYGGLVNITGSFSNIPQNFRVIIDAVDECKNATLVNNSLVQCFFDHGYNDTDHSVAILSDGLMKEQLVNFHYVEIACPYNCSYPNGECDKIYGICTCNYNWLSGSGCEKLSINTDSIEPTTINGGLTHIIGDYYNITTFDQKFIPSSISIKIGESFCKDIQIINQTKLQCNILPGKQGKKDVTISFGPSYELKNNLFEYFNNTCLYNCSQPHGTCNLFNGVCTCDSQTNGTGCENSKLVITSIDPTEEPGGVTNVSGFFGIPTSDFSIKVGDLKCDNLQQLNDSFIQCTVPPGKGFKNVTVSDRDLSTTGVLFFQYFAPFVTNAPKQCAGCGASNQGYCGSQGCICYPPWIGVDCQSQFIIIPQPQKNVTNPSVEMPTLAKPNSTNSSGGGGDGGDGDKIEKNIFKSLIAIVKLSELDLNSNEIKSYTFGQWIYTELSSTKYQYNTTIKVSPNELSSNETETNLSVTLEWFESESKVKFAGEDILMNPSSIKYTIEISEYRFSSKLNQLQLVMMAELSSNKTQDLCSNNEFGETSSGDNSNYIKIQVDNHSLYGRFIKRAIIDSRPRAIGNILLDESMKPLKSASSSQSYVGIVIPYYQKQIIIDPDFSVLIDSKTTTNKDSICILTNEKSGLSKTQLVGIIVGCILFSCCITAMILYHFYKKRRDRALVNSVKLKKTGN